MVPSPLLVFDLDGTLVDSNAACVEILRAILRDRNSPVEIDPVAATVHMSRGGRDMVRALLGPACGDPDADLREFRARYAVHTTAPETLFPGVADGLARLAEAGFTMAICSNKPQNLCEKVLADTGLAGHFATVVGGRPALRPKPAPDLLDAVLAAHGVAAAAAVFIGDSEIDHAVAEEAGMAFHFMTYGYAVPGWQPTHGTAHGEFTALVSRLLADHRA